MVKGKSITKSFRTTEDQFDQANEIFKREGFSYSEAIRLLLEATIREGRIPRALGTKDVEEISDKAACREKYVDSILNMALPNPKHEGLSDGEKVMRYIFGEPEEARTMTNSALREWGDKWGLPDNLSVATLADLHDSKLFPDDPWFGDYDYDIEDNGKFEDVLVLMKFRENIKNNLEKVKHTLEIKAVKTLMELDIEKDDEEAVNAENEEDD